MYEMTEVLCVVVSPDVTMTSAMPATGDAAKPELLNRVSPLAGPAPALPEAIKEPATVNELDAPLNTAAHVCHPLGVRLPLSSVPASMANELTELLSRMASVLATPPSKR
jgi:hypothetical protein